MQAQKFSPFLADPFNLCTNLCDLPGVGKKASEVWVANGYLKPRQIFGLFLTMGDEEFVKYAEEVIGMRKNNSIELTRLLDQKWTVMSASGQCSPLDVIVSKSAVVLKLRWKRRLSFSMTWSSRKFSQRPANYQLRAGMFPEVQGGSYAQAAHSSLGS